MVFSNLHIIPNSGILMLIKLGTNREKNRNWLLQFFYAIKCSVCFETPCVLIPNRLV